MMRRTCRSPRDSPRSRRSSSISRRDRAADSISWAHHDTESGHIPLLVALVVGWLTGQRGHGGKVVAVRSSSLRMRPRWAVAVGLATAWLLPVGAPAGGADPSAIIRRPSCPRAGTRRSLPVLSDPARRHRAAGRLVSGAHARRRRGSSDRPGPRPSGSGRAGAWRSIDRGAPTTARAWRTGSPALRTTSISAARRRSSCGPTWPTGTSSRRGIRRCPTLGGRRWPSGRAPTTSSPTAPRGPTRICKRNGRAARAAPRRGSLRGLPGQSLGDGPAPSVAKAMGERPRLDRREDLDPRRDSSRLGQRERGRRLSPCSSSRPGIGSGTCQMTLSGAASTQRAGIEGDDVGGGQELDRRAAPIGHVHVEDDPRGSELGRSTSVIAAEK